MVTVGLEGLLLCLGALIKKNANGVHSNKGNRNSRLLCYSQTLQSPLETGFAASMPFCTIKKGEKKAFSKLGISSQIIVFT